MTFVLKVGVDGWVVGCCLAPPAVGHDVEWLLQFHEQATMPFADSESLQSLEATASRRAEWDGLTLDRVPMMLRCGGADLYWENAQPPSDAQLLTGTITIAQHGEAPKDFPTVQGRIRRVRMAHTLYEEQPPGSRSWTPVRPADVRYEDRDAAPKWFPDHDGGTSPARFSNSVLVELQVP